MFVYGCTKEEAEKMVRKASKTLSKNMLKYGTYNKGKTMEEAIGKIKAQKLRKHMSQIRKGVTWEQQHGQVISDKRKMKAGIEVKSRFDNVEWVNKYKQISRGLWKNKETRKRMTDGIRKYFEENIIGKTFEEIHGKEKSEAILEKMKIIGKERTKQWVGKTIEEIFGTKQGNLIRQKLKKEWKLNKDKRVRNILKGLLKRPTSFEQRFIDLCIKHQLTYKYVGDGELIIGGKNPDFVNTNGMKILVETYHYYPARKSYETERPKCFTPFGFDTLFLKDEDLFCKDWENHCLNKIKDIENKWIKEHTKTEA